MLCSQIEPLVTVIVPVYNLEHYIKRSIDSVLKQYLQNFELIVIDDCSNDESAVVIKSSVDDQRIRFIELKRNVGFGPLYAILALVLWKANMWRF